MLGDNEDWKAADHWFRRPLLLVLLTFLGGCTNTLLVEGDFPEPLVEKMPVTAGVYLPDSFLNHQYEEQSEERDKWVILLGEAQSEMFRSVLPGMFESIVPLDSAPPWDTPPPADLVLVPSLEEFQYTLPAETNISVYEIWLKYNIRVFQPNGELLADWILTAYGKTPEGFMQSNEAALNQAIVVALRDAGANLSLNFNKVPEIRVWLDEQ